MGKEYTFQPDYSVHPGEFLEDIIESRNLTKRDVAQRLDVNPSLITNITACKKPIGPELAIKLEHVLGVSRNIWINMNSDYRMFQEKQKEKARLKKRTNWVKEFPIKFLKNLNLVPDTANYQKLAAALLDFFGISTPEVWDKYYGTQAAQLRQSQAFDYDPKALETWIRAGEKFAEEEVIDSYDKKLFRKNLTKIKTLTQKGPEEFIPEMKKLCAEAGVALTFVPEPKGISVYGCTKLLNKKNPLIIQSLRRKVNDHFWFTFFHEAGHVLLHGKRDIFIDNENTESKKEDEADQFARESLINLKEYKIFTEHGDFDRLAIQSFAYEQNVDPGIVVGFLQHDEHIAFSWYNGLKKEINFNKITLNPS